MKVMAYIGNIKRTLLVLAVGHVTISLILSIVGQTHILAGLHNPYGVWNFAMDSRLYSENIIALAHTARTDGWRTWLITPAWIHEKLYSIPYVIFGDSMRSAIVINTPLYILTLWLAYRIATVLFDERAGTVTLAGVALFPSFLLHTTQLLREPLLICGQFAFIYGLVSFPTRPFSGRRLAAHAGWTIGGFAVVWALKFYIASFYIALAMAFFVCFVWLWVKRRGLSRNALLAAGASLVICCMIQRNAAFFDTYLVSSRAGAFNEPPRNTPTREGPWWNLAANVRHKASVIATLRSHFAQSYTSSASNIDTTVQFKGTGDIVRYLPRALSIGLMAPFPSMWFTLGKQTGRIGRVLAGMETSVMYVMIMLAFFTLWQQRQRPVLWLLMGFMLAGVTLHALVILNVGCLYRFRYFFWFLSIILASCTASHHLMPSSQDPR
jgi:hypothetical protein